MANQAQFVKIVHLNHSVALVAFDHYSTRHVSVHKRNIIRGMLSVPMYITTMVISMTWNSIRCVAACVCSGVRQYLPLSHPVSNITWQWQVLTHTRADACCHTPYGISCNTYDHSSNVHRKWKHTPDDGSFMNRNMSGRVMITTQPTQLSGSSGQF